MAMMGMPSQLLLLFDGRMRRHLPVYGAIPLGSDPVPDFGRVDLAMYVLGATQPESVRVFPPPAHIVHLDTDRGSVWLEDGHEIPSPPRELAIREMVPQAGTISLSPPRPELALPAFVGTDPTLRPYQIDVVVQLMVNSLQELPTVRISQRLVEFAYSGGPVPITAGLYIPVTVGHTRTWHEAVLRLMADMGNGRFAAAILSADPELCAEPEMVIRSTGEDQPGHANPPATLTAAIATVVEAGRPRGLEADVQAMAKLCQPGPDLPIKCSTCGQIHQPDTFTPEQLETISFWTEFLPCTCEQPMLKRVLEMYRRHPEARGKVMNKFDAVMRSSDPAIRRLSFEMTTAIGDMPDPRPATYQQDLLRWTDGDKELADYLESNSCDAEKRLQLLDGTAAVWCKRLGGRRVGCSVCGKGPLILGMRGRMPDQ